jgi:hypothetical protein
MSSLKVRRAGALWVALALLALTALPAAAQLPPPPPPPAFAVAPPPAIVPPPSPEASEIAACLCLRQSVDALGADMSARQRTYDASREEVASLDAQLQGARAALNVNDPAAVAQYRQLLERRDAAYRRSSGATVAEYSGVVERYNARANEYNARCADRPRNPVLLAQVQATLTCGPPQ